METFSNKNGSKSSEHEQAKADSFSEKTDPLTELQKIVAEHKVTIVTQTKQIKDTNQTMKVVICVLLVMVAAMIFGLQIAIWQSKQSDSSKNITLIIKQ